MPTTLSTYSLKQTGTTVGIGLFPHLYDGLLQGFAPATKLYYYYPMRGRLDNRCPGDRCSAQIFLFLLLWNFLRQERESVGLCLSRKTALIPTTTTVIPPTPALTNG
jgi:hypothetical protein